MRKGALNERLDTYLWLLLTVIYRALLAIARNVIMIGLLSKRGDVVMTSPRCFLCMLYCLRNKKTISWGQNSRAIG